MLSMTERRMFTLTTLSPFQPLKRKKMFIDFVIIAICNFFMLLTT